MRSTRRSMSSRSFVLICSNSTASIVGPFSYESFLLQPSDKSVMA